LKTAVLILVLYSDIFEGTRTRRLQYSTPSLLTKVMQTKPYYAGVV